MSSGFVPGGTLDTPIERDAEWHEAQAAIEASRRRKAELAAQNDGKSLFEILQANKAAKQEAFEEAARLKNQYRALNEDEAGFLEEVLGKERVAEREVRSEVEREVEGFRRRREEVEKMNGANDGEVEGDVEKVDVVWKGVGRKRKGGGAEGLLRGVKIRRVVGAAKERVEGEEGGAKDAESGVKIVDVEEGKKTAEPLKQISVPPLKLAANPLAFGLGYGSSDEDD